MTRLTNNTRRRSRSVQYAIAALNFELHWHFNRARSSGSELPLQESFDGQFVQVLKTSALQNFDLVHLPILIQLQAKTTSSLRAVDYESNRIFRLDFFYQAGRRSGCYDGFRAVA